MENYISAAQFCLGHQIDISFITLLDERGLITIEKENEILYIKDSELPELEKIVHLYYELGINIEGIETILNILNKNRELREEIIMLKNRLVFYKGILEDPGNAEL